MKCLSRIYFKKLKIHDGNPQNPVVSIPWSWNREGAEINPGLWLWSSAESRKYDVSDWEVGKLRIDFGKDIRPIEIDPICDACLDLSKVVTFKIEHGWDICQKRRIPLRNCTGWQVLYILQDPLRNDVHVDWEAGTPKDLLVLAEMNWDGWVFFSTGHNDSNQPISGYLRPMNAEGDTYFITHIGVVSKKMPRYEIMSHIENQFLDSMYDGRIVLLRNPYRPETFFRTRLRMILTRAPLDSPEQQKTTEKTMIHNTNKPRRHTIGCDKVEETMHTAGSWWGHMDLMSQYVVHSTVNLCIPYYVKCIH